PGFSRCFPGWCVRSGVAGGGPCGRCRFDRIVIGGQSNERPEYPAQGRQVVSSLVLFHTTQARCQIAPVFSGLSGSTRTALPRIGLESMKEPTQDAMIKELMHGPSHPSPSSAAVPTMMRMMPLENTSVTMLTMDDRFGSRRCPP